MWGPTAVELAWHVWVDSHRRELLTQEARLTDKSLFRVLKQLIDKDIRDAPGQL